MHALHGLLHVHVEGDPAAGAGAAAQSQEVGALPRSVVRVRARDIQVLDGQVVLVALVVHGHAVVAVRGHGLVLALAHARAARVVGLEEADLRHVPPELHVIGVVEQEGIVLRLVLLLNALHAGRNARAAVVAAREGRAVGDVARRTRALVAAVEVLAPAAVRGELAAAVVRPVALVQVHRRGVVAVNLVPGHGDEPPPGVRRARRHGHTPPRSRTFTGFVSHGAVAQGAIWKTFRALSPGACISNWKSPVSVGESSLSNTSIRTMSVCHGSNLDTVGYVRPKFTTVQCSSALEVDTSMESAFATFSMRTRVCPGAARNTSFPKGQRLMRATASARTSDTTTFGNLTSRSSSV